MLPNANYWSHNVNSQTPHEQPSNVPQSPCLPVVYGAQNDRDNNCCKGHQPTTSLSNVTQTGVSPQVLANLHLPTQGCLELNLRKAKWVTL